MSDIGINGVLAQIRALRTQIDGNGGQTTISAAAGAASGARENGGLSPVSGFGDALTRVIDQVSQTQDQANQLADRFERGDRETSLAQVMLAMQKAQVSFKAMAEVRNRLVQAYQDIQNMPL